MELDGITIKNAILKFSDAWASKVGSQGSIPTFNDHQMKIALQLIQANFDSIPWGQGRRKIVSRLCEIAPEEQVQRFLRQVVDWYLGRFVSFETRSMSLKNQPDPFNQPEDDKAWNFNLSQGRFDCMKWKDHILFKTTYDLVIYQMLIWDIKPKTIIELGSGNGGSAVWMSDLLKVYDLDCHIYSMDVNLPDFSYRDVTFLQGDSNHIESVFDKTMLDQLPHPLIVIEDAHVNVRGVLEFFHESLNIGDYLIIEDSGQALEPHSKQPVIADFISIKNNCYQVDTHYCDFFGHNVTCSVNSIFKKVF